MEACSSSSGILMTRLQLSTAWGGGGDMIRAECAGMSGLNGNNSQNCCGNIGI